jgi:hypothetical protein
LTLTASLFYGCASGVLHGLPADIQAARRNNKENASQIAENKMGTEFIYYGWGYDK